MDIEMHHGSNVRHSPRSPHAYKTSRESNVKGRVEARMTYKVRKAPSRHYICH